MGVRRDEPIALKGLNRAKGMPASMADAPQAAFESALPMGDVWALDQLCKELRSALPCPRWN